MIKWRLLNINKNILKKKKQNTHTLQKLLQTLQIEKYKEKLSKYLIN
jgi:hypothetical protein